MRLTIKAGKVESATGIRRHDKQTEQFYSVTEREWIEMEGIHEARREGRKLAEAVADILRPELAKLNQEARDEFWRLLFEAAKKRWKPRDEPPNPQRPKESLLPPGYVAPSIDTSVGKVTFQNNDAPSGEKADRFPPAGFHGAANGRSQKRRDSGATARGRYLRLGGVGRHSDRGTRLRRIGGRAGTIHRGNDRRARTSNRGPSKRPGKHAERLGAVDSIEIGEARWHNWSKLRQS
jgi:hypothetical protein